MIYKKTLIQFAYIHIDNIQILCYFIAIVTIIFPNFYVFKTRTILLQQYVYIYLA